MTIAEQIQFAKDQELLTVEQFSLLTQYPKKSIYRLIAKRALTFVRIGPTAIRIPKGALKLIRAKVALDASPL